MRALGGWRRGGLWLLRRLTWTPAAGLLVVSEFAEKPTSGSRQKQNIHYVLDDMVAQLQTPSASWSPVLSCSSPSWKHSGQGSIDLAFVRPKMPLFGNTFSPKKTPPRKSASLSNLHNLDRSTREVELGLDYGTPTMNLAGQSLKFENGLWIAETGISGGVDRREAQRLRRRNQQLEEENNLLRLKVDILLDMLSETTAESHLMEKELDELKSVSRRRK
ncbi:protein chibby homolog 1 isoform X1 [Pteropus medius]|uniref:protein chibby homolog 1 isoform X1 n=1 Tax=Pteropus vampyrus TaxID=132908 RepID=UPI00196AA0FB|nr:protein chibby homolog 1 isoform X1 [Pteropus giganteus]